MLIVEQKSAGRDLKAAYAQAAEYFDALPHRERPRYILVSDFQTFELHDLDEREAVAFPLSDLPAHVDAFGLILGVQRRTIRDHRAILRSEPYASADLGAVSDLTAKSILSEAAPVSPAPAISPQRHSAVIAPAHGDGTPDRQHRFRWEARPGRGGRDDSVRARSPFADYVKT